jgi:hypothetical protein
MKTFNERWALNLTPAEHVGWFVGGYEVKMVDSGETLVVKALKVELLEGVES